MRSSYLFFPQALGTLQEHETRHTVLRNRYFPSHSQVCTTENTNKISNNHTKFPFTKFIINLMHAGRSIFQLTKETFCAVVSCSKLPLLLCVDFLYKQSIREKFYCCCFSLVGHMVKSGADQRVGFLW